MKKHTKCDIINTFGGICDFPHTNQGGSMMASLGDIVHDYLAQRHFDLMDADRKDRFDDLKEKGLFTGHMKKWDDLYAGKPLQMLDNTTIPDPDDWEKLYDSCQQAFQGMDAVKKNETGYGSPYNGPTKDFIAEWFGDNTKVFTGSKATSDAEQLFKDLGVFLENHKSDIQPRFTKNLTYVFNSEMPYDKFVKFLKTGKFNDNVRFEDGSTFRDKVEQVVQYITTYGPINGVSYEPEISDWPKNLGYSFAGDEITLTDPVLQGLQNLPTAPHRIDKDNPKSWYEIPNKAEHIKWFKEGAYRAIFDELLKNSTKRTKFLEKAGNPIRDALQEAIANTDYENKDSDDYVKPEPLDKKNWRQKVKKWKNDAYENYFRRFFDHNRGARLFYSPFSQNIMKGLDKVGVKPTDGIDGILAKKDDAKLRSVIDEDRVTKKHFDWFTKTMETLKEQIPDAYEGALRNGVQLRQVAMYVITMAAKEGETAKAKTALEILSVAKYGLTMSRTMDKIDEATKEMKLVNDEGYSWMKSEYLKPFANAANSLIGFGIRALGRVGVGTYNFIQHRRTKIDKDISKGKKEDSPYHHLYKEYTEWQGKDKFKRDALHDENIAYDVAGKLAELNNTTRSTAGGSPYKTTIQINDVTMGTEEAPGPLRTAIETAVSTGAATVTDPSTGTVVNLADLQNDVTIYEDVQERHLLETNDEKWREKNPDDIHDLVAYWNMLESYGKTHSFGFGSMKVKRKDFLENWKDKKSPAQTVANAYIEKFGTLRT